MWVDEWVWVWWEEEGMNVEEMDGKRQKSETRDKTV
jgi:hypothetical protein